MAKKSSEHPEQLLSSRPGKQHEMVEKPETVKNDYRPAGKLSGKVALITGGDSGIGRAVAVAFAKEGADIAISYLEEAKDAKKTQALVEAEGRRCICIAGDIGSQPFCEEIVQDTVEQLGGLNIVVNNAAEQHPQSNIEYISSEQLERTFRTNVFGMFYVAQAALPHLREGDSVINTTSVTAYKGNPKLLDYSSTKGAIVAFTRSLNISLAQKGIRVNAVAPGPIWTPLIPSTFSPEKVKKFGKDVPMGRSGEPAEVAPAYVFLASSEASYISGQVIHVNGGEVVNG